MTAAFAYLVACSFRNRVRSQLRRLRQPRYLAGLVVGVLYIYLVFLRPGSRSSRPDIGAGFMQFPAEAMQAAMSVVLFLIVAMSWLIPTKRGAIDFTRSEVQFLFTAPVTRRQLIHYKLLRGQLGALFSSLIFTLLMRPGDPLTGLRVMLGLWLTLGLVNLHLIGVGLSRVSLIEHGASGRRRFGLPALIVVGAVVTLVGVVVSNWAALSALGSGREVFRELVRLATTGVAGAILWPFRSAVALTLAGSAAEFGWAFAVVAALFVLNYVWVVRSDTAFEEASAEIAEKRLHDPMAARPKVAKRLNAPFRLAPRGRVETAILWKNLILVSRYVSLATVFRLLPLVVIFGVMFSQSGRAGLAEMMGFFSLTLIVMVVLMGPMLARNDLRQDLSNLAMLKTWPVSGRTLLRGEVLAPTVLLSVGVLVLIVAAASLLTPTMMKAGVPWSDQLAYVVSAILVAPALILGQVVLQNAIAVLLPAWAGLGSSRGGRGIDAMGQRILLTFGTFVGLLIGLIPAWLIAGGVGVTLYAITDRVMILIPAVTSAGVVLAECWVATELLGHVLDRTDVSAIEAEER
jgi:hypothetical protein